MRYLTYIRILQPGVAALRSLLENAYNSCFRRLPVHVSLAFGFTGCGQAAMEILAQRPIHVASFSSSFQVAEIRFHNMQKFSGFVFGLLNNSGRVGCIDFGVSQEILDYEQTLDGQKASFVSFLRNKCTERDGKVGRSKDQPDRLSFVQNNRGFFPLHDKRLIHTTNAEIASVDQT